MLNFKNSKAHCKHKFKKKPVEIFDQAYEICAELEREKHPEQKISKIWGRLRKKEKISLCETHIIFSCVYVILLLTETKNPNIQFFLSCCRQRIDDGYFLEFEHLIREELTQKTAETDDIEALKKVAEKIYDLNERELFYIGHLEHHKQIQHKGNIVEQIIDAIECIRQTRALTAIAKDTTDLATMKVKSIVILELLTKMQLGKSRNDLSKICRLIAYLTDISYNSVYNAMQNGVCFTDHHKEEIKKANKILKDLNTLISIDIDKQY